MGSRQVGTGRDSLGLACVQGQETSGPAKAASPPLPPSSLQRALIERRSSDAAWDGAERNGVQGTPTQTRRGSRDTGTGYEPFDRQVMSPSTGGVPLADLAERNGGSPPGDRRRGSTEPNRFSTAEPATRHGSGEGLPRLRNPSPDYAPPPRRGEAHNQHDPGSGDRLVPEISAMFPQRGGGRSWTSEEVYLGTEGTEGVDAEGLNSATGVPRP